MTQKTGGKSHPWTKVPASGSNQNPTTSHNSPANSPGLRSTAGGDNSPIQITSLNIKNIYNKNQDSQTPGNKNKND